MNILRSLFLSILTALIFYGSVSYSYDIEINGSLRTNITMILEQLSSISSEPLLRDQTVRFIAVDNNNPTLICSDPFLNATNSTITLQNIRFIPCSLNNSITLEASNLIFDNVVVSSVNLGANMVVCDAFSSVTFRNSLFQNITFQLSSLVFSQCNVTFENCTFTTFLTTSRGPVIYRINSTHPTYLSITKSIFRNITTISEGAILYAKNITYSLHMKDSLIENNLAATGAGFLFEDSVGEIVIESSSFNSQRTNGSSTQGGTSLLTRGSSGNSTVTILNCTFSSSSATFGSVYSHFSHPLVLLVKDTRIIRNSGEGAFIVRSTSTNEASVTMINITATNNIGPRGSVFSSRDSFLKLHISDSLFSSNNATSDGGVIYLGGSSNYFEGSINIERCIMTNNAASNDGGVIYTSIIRSGSTIAFNHNSISNNLSGRDAGVMFATNAQNGTVIKFINNTITDNISIRFGGVYSLAFAGIITVQIENNLYQSNSGREGGVFNLFRTISSTATRQGVIIFNNNVFKKNTSPAGSVLSMRQCYYQLTIDPSNIFEENSATESGSVFFFVTMTALEPYVFQNLKFSNNIASIGGSVIRTLSATLDMKFINISFFNNTAGSQGVVLIGTGTIGSVEFENCTFNSNKATSNEVSALPASLIFAQEVDNIKIKNTIFVDNTSPTSVISLQKAKTLQIENIQVLSNNGPFLTIKNTKLDIEISNVKVQNFISTPLTFIEEPALFALSQFSGSYKLSDVSIQDSRSSGCFISTNFANGTLSITNLEVNNAIGCVGAFSGTSNITLNNIRITDTQNENPSRKYLLSTSQSVDSTLQDIYIEKSRTISVLGHSGINSFKANNVEIKDNVLQESAIEFSSGVSSLNQINIENNTVTLGNCLKTSSSAILTLTDSQIVSCLSDCAAAFRENSDVFVYSTDFEDNLGSYCSHLIVSDSVEFTGDNLSFKNGYSKISNGAFVASGSRTVALLNNTVFEENTGELGGSSISILSGAKATLENVNIINGETVLDGSCIYLDSSNLDFRRGSVTRCTSPGFGAALTISGKSSASIDEIIFSSNFADEGAVASFQKLLGTSLSFTNCQFVSNKAQNGGVFSFDYSDGGFIIFKNSEFTGNEATGFGGVFLSADSSSARFEDCSFTNNRGLVGGIGYLDWYSNLSFENCKFVNNTSKEAAGCFYLDKYSSLNVTESNFEKSSTDKSGGVIFMTLSSSLFVKSTNFYDNSAKESGGVIFGTDSDCNAKVENVTAVRNKASPTSGKGGFLSFDMSRNDSLTINNLTCKSNSAAFGGCLNLEDLNFSPNLDTTYFENNTAKIFGDDINSAPDRISSEASFKVKTGGFLQEFLISLLRRDGGLYTLPLTQEFIVVIAPIGNFNISGAVQNSISRGVSRFSTVNNEIQVFGNPGKYSIQAGPRLSDPFYSVEKYSTILSLEIEECPGDSIVQNQICKLIECTECQNGVCVTPGNCSCNATWEGLRCDLKENLYESIDLVFDTLPDAKSKRQEDLITVEKRNRLISLVQSALDSSGVVVEYRKLYLNVDGKFVMKVSLLKGTDYVEGKELEEYKNQIIAFLNQQDIGVLGTQNEANAFYIESNSPISVAVYIFSFILIGITVTIALVVFIHVKTPIIMAASPLFCFLILLGFVISYLTFLPYIGKPTKSSCATQIFLGPIAFAIVFGNLFTKTFRIYKIFANKKMRRILIQNHHLLAFSAVILSIELLLSIIWVAVDAPQPIVKGQGESRYWTCQSRDQSFGFAMTGLLFSYNGILLLFGTFLAVQTRQAFSAFRESQMIGFSIYIITTVACCVVPVIYIESIPLNVQFALRSFAVIFITSCTMGFLFFPKIYIIFVKPERNNTDNLNSSISFPGMKMERTGSSKLGFGKEMLEEGFMKGWILVKKVSGVSILSQWEKKFAIRSGNYFGFFEEEDGRGKGGMRPIVNCEFSKATDGGSNDYSFFFSDGLDTYRIECSKPEETQRWYESLVGVNPTSTSTIQ